MNYTQPFLRKVETGKEEEQKQQHHPQSGVSYRAAVAAKNVLNSNASINALEIIIQMCSTIQ